MNRTLEYYNEKAACYVTDTQDVDFRQTQDKFIEYVRPGGRILDFGCGSGRDTKYYMERGFMVDAVDGSEKMCEIASVYIGHQVRRMLFQELDATEEYDGIWACSSILHLSKEELRDVLVKMYTALKPGGVIYTSFKYGTYEGVRNGRYFTDFTEDSFRELVRDVSERLLDTSVAVEMTRLTLEEMWVSADVRPGRSKEQWLNAILGKK